MPWVFPLRAKSVVMPVRERCDLASCVLQPELIPHSCDDDVQADLIAKYTGVALQRERRQRVGTTRGIDRALLVCVTLLTLLPCLVSLRGIVTRRDSQV